MCVVDAQCLAPKRQSKCLWWRGLAWGPPPYTTHRHVILVHCTGAKASLSVAGWERRFVDTLGLDDVSHGEGDRENSDGAGQGDRGEAGNGNGIYGMMLISSTHHRFSGLFTTRGPRAPPLTQLLVRGLLAWPTLVHRDKDASTVAKACSWPREWRKEWRTGCITRLRAARGIGVLPDL